MTEKIRRGSPPEIAINVALGWSVPGLGHFAAGARRQGAILFVLIAGTFLAGIILSDLEAVSRELHPYAFFAQIGFGGATIPLLYLDPARDKVLDPNSSIQELKTVPRYNDTGVLFCSIAGLLNALVLFDLVDRQGNPSSRRKPAHT